MFGTLLDVVSSGVVGDKVTGDNTPGGYVNPGGNNELATGILIGILISLCAWGIIKVVKLIISDHREKKQNNGG